MEEDKGVLLHHPLAGPRYTLTAFSRLLNDRDLYREIRRNAILSSEGRATSSFEEARREANSLGVPFPADWDFRRLCETSLSWGA